jgi:hypothetical protein
MTWPVCQALAYSIAMADTQTAENLEHALAPADCAARYRNYTIIVRYRAANAVQGKVHAAATVLRDCQVARRRARRCAKTLFGRLEITSRTFWL